MKITILNKAIHQAELSDQRFRLGAIIFKGTRIFGVGHNDKRNSPKIPQKYKKFNHAYHAEMSAIMNTDNFEKLKGASILVIRINKNGDIAKSYPCEYCMDSLRYFGIKILYYSNSLSEIKREKINA